MMCRPNLGEEYATRLRQIILPMATLLLMLVVGVFLAGCGESKSAPELTEEEEQALLDEAIAEANGDLGAFVATGVNPCAIDLGGPIGLYERFSYEDLESLINDVDLIVEGRFGVSSMEPPRAGTVASRMLVEFVVEDVLFGDSPGGEMRLDVGGRVMLSGERPSRFGVPSFDQCAIDQAILFLKSDNDEDVRGVVAYLAFADGTSEADSYRELVGEGVAMEDVRADILRVIEDQQAEDIPHGRLVCESRRNSSVYGNLFACPGDSFNPYEVYGLARSLEIGVSRESGSGEQIASRFGIETDAPEVVDLLALLDQTVWLDAGDRPDGESIVLRVTTTTTGTPPFSVSLRYDVATDWVWVSLSGGGFDAPEGFGEALEALLEAAPSDSPGVETETPESTTTPAPTMGRGVPQSTPSAPRTSVGPEMRLTVVAGGFCTGSDCYVDAGSTFTLAVEVLEAPPSYVLLQTFIDYGVYDPTASEDGAGPGSCGDGIENGLRDRADRKDVDCVTLELTYLPTAGAADEIFWTDLAPAVALRVDDVGPGLVGHGGITGLIPPLPESSETGVVIQLQMLCPVDATTVPISLLLPENPLAGTSGSMFVGPGGGLQIVPLVTPINLHCE